MTLFIFAIEDTLYCFIITFIFITFNFEQHTTHVWMYYRVGVYMYTCLKMYLQYTIGRLKLLPKLKQTTSWYFEIKNVYVYKYYFNLQMQIYYLIKYYMFIIKWKHQTQKLYKLN